MIINTQKISTFVLVLGAAIIAFGASASAHVTVKPAEVVTAGYQTFTVSVPNEKSIPTTSIKLEMPTGITSATPTQKAGWQIMTDKDSSSDAAKVQSITWSGGSIGEGLRDEFTFSAKVPDQATELQWKAYQTYADGTVVAWDKASEDNHSGHGGNSGPFSVTRVVIETAAATAATNTDAAALAAKETADRALYLAGAGVIVGLIAIAAATRKSK